MKLKFGFILVFISFLFCFQVFSALERRLLSAFFIPEQDISIDLLSEEDNLSKGEKLFREKILKGEMRAISVDDNIQFDKTVFGGANYFYLGAGQNIAPSGMSALVSVYLQPGITAAQNSLEFVPLASQKIVLNEQSLGGDYIEIDSPIYNSRITNLTLMGNYPVVTITNPNIVHNPDSYLGPNKNVYLINDLQTGRFVKTNEVEINDSDGNLTNGAVGFASNGGSIFVAVRPKTGDGNFGEANSGFAVLVQDEKKLKPINATTGDRTGNQAFNLNLNVDRLLAIQNPVLVGDRNGFGDMYWDSNLQRLFIGLVDVRRADQTDAGGVVSFLVARVSQNGALIIEPAVGLQEEFFDDDETYHVVGFYNTLMNNDDVRASIRKVRTLHTSTGKSYIILESEIAEPPAVAPRIKIHALPIVSLVRNDGTAIDAQNVGKIAQRDIATNVVDFENVINGANQLLQVDNAVNVNDFLKATVGAGELPTTNLQGLFVVGDSVFACVSGNRTDPDTQETGIFRSTAIFSNNGQIRAWTPWQRVMGNIDKVFGAGLDTTLGDYWYLTGDNQNVVKVTQWGKSVASAGLMGNGLVDLLSEEFTQENAGVHQVFNFDEKTPSIARNNPANELSFMVATGFGKVALIETGAGSPFTPTQNKFQTTAPQNVFVKEEDVLSEIGPICCADVSRVQAANKGWLFVGGDGGIAVLRDAQGYGWDGRRGEAAINLQNISAFTFKKLIKNDNNSFSQVRKIICQGDTQYLYIMIVNKLYRVLMDPDKFKDANPDDLDEKEISTPHGNLLDMMIFYRVGNNIRLLVATTKGLFCSNDIDDHDINQNTNWTAVQVPGSLPGTFVPITDPVVHLSFISNEKGGFTTNGNLYVLAADFVLNLAKIYRFDIWNVNLYIDPANPPDYIRHIPETAGTNYFYSVGELRTNFVTDGAFGYHLLSKHFGQTNFVRKINFRLDQTYMRKFENDIDLDVPGNAYNVGIMFQNSASGAWVVPGDWGIRVNE